MEEKITQHSKKTEEPPEVISGKEEPTPQAEVPKPESELDQKNKALEKTTNKYLRTYAELENFKKHAAKEKADWIKYANEDLLREFLTVLDSLSRAKSHGESSPELSQWIEGVSLTIKQFEDTLGRFGVTPIQAVGVPFNPSVHQAMSQVESEEAAGTVIEEFQKGYRLHDRVLRPALVSVAKNRQAENITEEEKEGGSHHG